MRITRPTARGLPSSETKVPFDEPSCPSLLPAQHRRAVAGEAEGPWTLPLSSSCTAAARGSHPLAPSLSPNLGGQAWSCRHHPQHNPVPVLHHPSWPCVHPVPHAGCLVAVVPLLGTGLLLGVLDGQRVKALSCNGSRWAGWDRGGSAPRADSSLCHSIPLPLPPSAPAELCSRFSSLCPSSLLPPLGLSASTRALQQQ